MQKNKWWQVVGLLVLVLGLGVSVYLVQQVAQFFGRASGAPANIVIDASLSSGFLPRPFRGLAQGGEDLLTFLDNIESRVKAISPSYIRIDHIYDGFDVVSKNGESLVFDWSRLDKVVDQIRSIGATPFFALSYMPPVIAKTDIVSSPKNWEEWSLVVERTIEHYSGEKKIPGVYYEVWNEPDLFGKMKVKEYIPLYRWAAVGARRADKVLAFKLGGPATTGLYKNWVEALLFVAEAEKLRLDFISWHRYDRNPAKFATDMTEVEGWIAGKPFFADIETLVTEWGPDSNNSPMYDGISGAAHLLSVVRQQMGRLNLGFMFSIKDGKDPNGQAMWGRWGFFSSDASGNKSKPRYTALQWLTSLGEERLAVSGEGSWVVGVATKKGKTVQVLLTNYDPGGVHSETVPVKIVGLPGANYSYREKFMSGGERNLTMAPVGGEVSFQLYMGINDSVFLELTEK